MPHALFVAHDPVSLPGLVGERFADRGWDLKVQVVVPADRGHDPAVGVSFPDPAEYDAIVPLGAPWAVYDEATTGTWVPPELDLLRRADEAEVPVLGICFGGQLLATAHGGAVGRSPAPEMGWHVVESGDPSLVDTGPWFQWHGDRWELPPQAREIARNPAASQAFLLRRNLAVQFHPEVDPEILQAWLDNGGVAAVEAAGLDVGLLMEQTEAQLPAARVRAAGLVDAFLDRVAARSPDSSA